MNLLIYLFFIIINGFFAYFNKKDTFLLKITFIYLLIFMLGNSSAPDYLSYFNDYNLMLTQGISSFNDIGYVFIEKFFVNLNLNYSFFRLAIISFSFVMLYYGLKKLEVNYHYIISIYMIYQCLMDTMQIRNFLATSIFIYGLQYLYLQGFNNKIKYILFNLLAASIHSSLLLYLLFLFKDSSFLQKKNIKILGIISITLSMFIFVFPESINIFSVFLSYIGKQELFIRYFSNAGSSLGFILPLFSFILFSLYILYVNKRNSISQDNWINKIYHLNIITMLFLPLIIIDPTWYRVNRNLNILNYSCISLSNKIQKRDFQKNISFSFGYFISLIWFFIECVIWIGLEKIIPMFFINGFFL